LLIAVTQAGALPLTPREASRAIAVLPPEYNFNLPMARAAVADEIDVFGFGCPDARWPGRTLRLATRPTILLIADDPGTPNGQGGPTAWTCTDALSRWCNAVMIHASGGEAAHYAEAVRAARLVGRLALIETTTLHAKAWASAINCPNTLLILPRDGEHPVAKGTVH
jgi:hypothetical protein